MVKLRRSRRLRAKKRKQKKFSLKNFIKKIKVPTSRALASQKIKKSLALAQKVIKAAGGKKNLSVPRILPLPKKIGGAFPIIPLIPIFSGLSAAGVLAGGVANIIKSINNATSAQKNLEEARRHNKSMESIAIGRGLYLKPYKTGCGLEISKNTTKNC